MDVPKVYYTIYVCIETNSVRIDPNRKDQVFLNCLNEKFQVNCSRANRFIVCLPLCTQFLQRIGTPFHGIFLVDECNGVRAPHGGFKTRAT